MGKLGTAGVRQSRAPHAVSWPKAGTELSSPAVLWLTSDASPEVFVRKGWPAHRWVDSKLCQAGGAGSDSASFLSRAASQVMRLDRAFPPRLVVELQATLHLGTEAPMCLSVAIQGPTNPSPSTGTAASLSKAALNTSRQQLMAGKAKNTRRKNRSRTCWVLAQPPRGELFTPVSRETSDSHPAAA